jgi:hypothetical protein
MPAIQDPSVVAAYMIELAKLEIVPRMVGFNEFRSPKIIGKAIPIFTNIKKYAPSKVEIDGK